MDHKSVPAAKQVEYSKPALTVYGSVRNLTGGSTATGNDGGGPMTAMMA